MPEYDPPVPLWQRVLIFAVAGILLVGLLAAGVKPPQCYTNPFMPDWLCGG